MVVKWDALNLNLELLRMAHDMSLTLFRFLRDDLHLGVRGHRMKKSDLAMRGFEKLIHRTDKSLKTN